MTGQIFKLGDELPALPTGLSDTDKLPPSDFGYKIIEIGGVPAWKAATEEDYRQSEAKRLGIKEVDVEIFLSCRMTAPRFCNGLCYGSGNCDIVYDPTPPNPYYYCICAG